MPGRDVKPNELEIDLFDTIRMVQKLLVHVLTLPNYRTGEGVQSRLQPLVWLDDYFNNKGRLRRDDSAGLQDQCLQPAYQALLGKGKPDFEKLMILFEQGQVIHLPVYSKNHLFSLSFFQLEGQLHMGVTNGGAWPRTSGSLEQRGILTDLPQVIYKLEGNLEIGDLKELYFAGTISVDRVTKAVKWDPDAIVERLNTFLCQHPVQGTLQVDTTILQDIGNCGWYNFTCAARISFYVKAYREARPGGSDLVQHGLGRFVRGVNQLYRDWLRDVQVYMLARCHNLCIQQGWLDSRAMQVFFIDCRNKIQADTDRYAHRDRDGYRQGVFQDFLREYDPEGGCIDRIPSAQTPVPPALSARVLVAPRVNFYPVAAPVAVTSATPLLPPVPPPPPKKCCVIL